jgi:DNA-binding transcriptional regulator YhcF (GntR family)
MVYLNVDRESVVPLYKQLTDQMRDKILTGVLEAETRLRAGRIKAR